MRTELLTVVPVGLLAAAAIWAVDAPAAYAGPPTYTCTAKALDGRQLAPVVVQARRGVYQARLRARPEWRGQADFDTITCTPN